MPRGEHPNSRKNLALSKGFNTETARKASQKSLETKKQYKSFQECFKDMMTQEQREDLFNTIYRKARAGNVKAFEVLRDTMGEKPIEKVMVAEVEQSTIDEVDEIIKAKKDDNQN